MSWLIAIGLPGKIPLEINYCISNDLYIKKIEDSRLISKFETDPKKFNYFYLLKDGVSNELIGKGIERKKIKSVGDTKELFSCLFRNNVYSVHFFIFFGHVPLNYKKITIRNEETIGINEFLNIYPLLEIETKYVIFREFQSVRKIII
jgi:hypothetical protein